MTVDDDDDNNNVNKYKITGGKNNGFNNEAFTHKRMYKESGKVVLLQGWVKRFDILEMLVFIITGQNRSNSMCIRK